eukprot:COSAG06_NODE_2738_length_6365_cov_366.789499_4_plen_148_part_00
MEAPVVASAVLVAGEPFWGEGGHLFQGIDNDPRKLRGMLKRLNLDGWDVTTGVEANQGVSFKLRFFRQVHEAQLEAHRLLSSTAGARSGAARASRSGRRPAGPADFWVLEQHLPRPLCACAKMLLHVAGFSAIVSRAPPVSGAWHAP